MDNNPNSKQPRKKELLEFRSIILHAIHNFFHSRGYTEVETPVRLPAPALEQHINAEPSGSYWLRTSPEFHMKRLLAAGHERIFQIGPCFRQGEQGSLHHPEYSMLEWYCTETDYLGILDETRQLLAFLAQTCGNTEYKATASALLNGKWEILPLRDCYRKLAGWDPWRKFDADRFDLDMVGIIEPALPPGPAVLIDYPPQCSAFARLNQAGECAERWELYLNRIEIANAYSELTDAAELCRRMKINRELRRTAGNCEYPDDKAFLDAMRKGLPPCGGIALGLDRLVMTLAGKQTIADVIAFLE